MFSHLPHCFALQLMTMTVVFTLRSKEQCKIMKMKATFQSETYGVFMIKYLNYRRANDLLFYFKQNNHSGISCCLVLFLSYGKKVIVFGIFIFLNKDVLPFPGSWSYSCEPQAMCDYYCQILCSVSCFTTSGQEGVKSDIDFSEDKSNCRCLNTMTTETPIFLC